MKKIIFLSILALITLTAQAQRTERFTFGTSIGTGIPMSRPSDVPFAWQVTGFYNISKQLSVGIGTGLSLYEKALIPVFADARFLLIKPGKFTPFLECSAGYSFAPDRNANGGFYMNPSVGVQYAMRNHRKLFFSLGYELQKLERVKKQEQPLFTAEFAEKLNHNFVSLKLGFIY